VQALGSGALVQMQTMTVADKSPFMVQVAKDILGFVVVAGGRPM
jgi:hypothetical protein